MRPNIKERLLAAMAACKIEGAPALAQAAGLRDSTARAYLNGSRKPSLPACEKIGPHLGVRGNWLYYGDGPMEAPIVQETDPMRLMFAAIEEALLQVGIGSEAAAEIAAVVELHVGNLKVPPGMEPEQAIRRLLRLEVPEILARKRKL